MAPRQTEKFKDKFKRFRFDCLKTFNSFWLQQLIYFTRLSYGKGDLSSNLKESFILYYFQFAQFFVVWNWQPERVAIKSN